jgi:2-alkyl-3-oxoalkanoate reductase
VTDRVLVLGARGFIGRRVVSQLSQSTQVAVVAAGRTASATGPGPSVETLVLDATDPEALRRALVGVQGVVNCVASDADTIVAAAKALFDAARQSRPIPRIVHFSSLLAYGTLDGPVDETVPPRGDLGPYSAAKLTTEKLAAELGSVITLRPGIVYGPGSPWWSDRIARLLCAGRLGDLGDAGEGYCNLVYVDDVATAAVRALFTPAAEGQTLNLGSTRIPTWNEYFAMYARALGALPLRRISQRRLSIEQIVIAPPLKFLELASRSRFLRGVSFPPPIRPWLLEHCRHRIAMSASRAEQTLGMQWTSLEEGLKQTAAWFLDGGRS